MLCTSFLRSVNLWAGNIERSIEVGRFRYICGGSNATCRLTYLWDRKFVGTRKMMVDSGSSARRPIIDVLTEKDDDGGFASGGWKR